jgi:DNA polymerase II
VNISMTRRNGWLMDLYPDQNKPGITLWFLDQDGERIKLFQPFPITFYAAGDTRMLREAWKYLKTLPQNFKLYRTEKQDIFQADPIAVLAVEVNNPAEQPQVFKALSAQFPDLDYYDADVTLFLRHASLHQTYPLCYCSIEHDDANTLLEIQVMETPWELSVTRPPIRILTIEPDHPPKHQKPTSLIIHQNGQRRKFKLLPERVLLITLNSILQQYDPDMLLTAWGDGWLLPYLLEQSTKHGLPLPLNRDTTQTILRKNDLVYFSYGQTIYRDQQIHLFGRWHVDIHNATLFHDYKIDGILELARVTSLPIQTVARVSPGSGISAMQMTTAMRQNILVPWHKQQAENTKTALDLTRTDSGGLVYQPTIGVHENVAGIDFVSMYPSIMVHENISPETFQSAPGSKDFVADQHEKPKGLIPNTLAPLLNKRVRIKQRLAEIQKWNPSYEIYKAQSSAHKWLLVTCFGYLGYKNARFGRIEAHEAVTAYGREALLRAKEIAEEMGYTILHMYVDGLWVKSETEITKENITPLLNAIEQETGLPISTDGIFRWVVFLPSKNNPRVPVANRYFGVFEDGSMKLRGIEIRRRDTPLWIAEIQQTLLQEIAALNKLDDFSNLQPKIIQYLKHEIQRLRDNQIPLEKLLVSQKVSRELSSYHSPSAAARAASQIVDSGKDIRPGQMIKFLYMQNTPRIQAWDIPENSFRDSLPDQQMYVKLLMRAVSTILSPFGMDEKMLYRCVLKNTNAPENKARQRPLFKRYSIMRTEDITKNNLRFSKDEEPPASSPQIDG